MKRKHITLPTSRATSISSRQWRMTAFRSNRSARNSIESTTTREGRLSRRARLITSTTWSRSSTDAIRYRSWDRGKDQDRGGPDEPAPEALVDDRDARGDPVRTRGHGARRGPRLPRSPSGGGRSPGAAFKRGAPRG